MALPSKQFNPTGATRVHVLGEIARAMNFDADNLFVNYR